MLQKSYEKDELDNANEMLQMRYTRYIYIISGLGAGFIFQQ